MIPEKTRFSANFLDRFVLEREKVTSPKGQLFTGFSGFIFFVGPPSIATGSSDQTFRRAENTGFSGVGHVGTSKNIF